MKEIPLTRGFVALVDEDDYDFLMQWKWRVMVTRNTNYAVRTFWIGRVNGKKISNKILMHREIIKPEKGLEVDHINHNGLDNRRENLRAVSHRVNLGNPSRINKFGFVGVRMRNRRRPASAVIKINGKTTYIGCFDTPELAHEAYLQKVAELENKDKV